MRKSTLIISALLTAALLFGLYSLVAAYQNALQISKDAAATAKASATEVISTEAVQAEAIQTEAPVIATEVPVVAGITIYEAATAAANVLGRTDLYTVENSQFNGAAAYLATFASGDILYLSLDGQVLSASKGAAPTIKQPTSHRGK